MHHYQQSIHLSEKLYINIDHYLASRNSQCEAITHFYIQGAANSLASVTFQLSLLGFYTNLKMTINNNLFTGY